MTKTNLCKYKNIFGEPNKGVHRNGAVVDWILTIILALVMATITYYADKYVKKNTKKLVIPFGLAFIIWFVLLYVVAVFLHYIFCVKTRVNVFLGLFK